MKRQVLMLTAILVSAAGILALAQGQRLPSPPGTAAVEVGGKYVSTADGPVYQNGKWIEVSYGRPIKRGRENLFGVGADYGKALYAGAPVWRAGANQTTRLTTEVPLTFDGKVLPAGQYSVFVDMKEKAWTLIFSSWPAQANYDPKNTKALWGAYGYTSDRDVLRTAMKLGTLPFSMDQFTIAFTDMSPTGGTLAMMWDRTLATVPFSFGR
jgi:Protein of unknown function (DUF2911)